MGAQAHLASDRAANVALDLLHVRLVDHIPEHVGSVQELREGDSREFFQTRTGVVEGHVTPLVKNHPGPTSHQVVDLRLGLQQSETQSLVRLAAATRGRPRLLLQPSSRGDRGFDVSKKSAGAAAPGEADPTVGLVGRAR